jgi:hypothetical protein
MIDTSSAAFQSLFLNWDYLDPDESVRFPVGHWPKLRRLSLGTSRILQESSEFSRFLAAHPSLEFIECFSFPRVPNGNLPSLRHLRVHEGDRFHNFIPPLSDQDDPKPYESLGLVYLTHRSNLCVFDIIDKTRLRRLELSFFESLDALVNLATLLPALTSLRIPPDERRRFWYPRPSIVPVGTNTQRQTLLLNNFFIG